MCDIGHRLFLAIRIQALDAIRVYRYSELDAVCNQSIGDYREG